MRGGPIRRGARQRGIRRMRARDQVLQRVRAALGRTAGQPAPPIPPVRIDPPSRSLEERLGSFQRSLETLTGKVYRAQSREEAREIVASLTFGKTAVASGATILRDCGITTLPQVQSEFADAGAMRNALAVSDFGITAADYGLAAPGSLVMLSSPTAARLV